MKCRWIQFFVLAALCAAQGQDAKPQNATEAIVRLFDAHNIVLFGEAHGCKQEYEWLAGLVANPEFAGRVDDIVVELGNSLYQNAVDAYIAGGDIPIEQVQLAWRNAGGMINAPSPVHEMLFRAVRESNLRRRGSHQLRIVLGGPPIDWDKITTRDQLAPFLSTRDSWYARTVKEEVIAKKRRALLIMGSFHFERTRGPGLIERELIASGASTHLILFDTKVYGDPQARFAAWPTPAIVDLKYNWLGDMPAMPEDYPGGPPKLKDLADAVLVLTRDPDSLTVLSMSRAELEETPYGKELDRRMMILRGQHLEIPNTTEKPLRSR
jgi:hypothetical protein